MTDRESKFVSECLACNFEYIEKSSRVNYSMVKCLVCGGVGEYRQDAIRRGEVRCKTCYETKMREECSAAGFTWIEKVDKNCSKCQCNVCGHVDVYQQANIRRGGVKCTNCYETKMREECAANGFTWIEKVDGRYTKCQCNVCGYVDDYQQTNIRDGKVRCSNCRLIKYHQAVKGGWTFINHLHENRNTYVNLKHSCGDSLVKVKIGHFLRGVYDCPICMHTHYNDPSYFYVIQVGDIIKLGISNRPDQRYTQYGLPEGYEVIEHIRIPLETKRDALVVESHAKQLAKDCKLPTEITKQVFTKGGFNECYSLDCLPMLMTI